MWKIREYVPGGAAPVLLAVVVVERSDWSYPFMVVFVSVLLASLVAVVSVVLASLVAVVTSGGPEVVITGGGLMTSEVTFIQ